MAKRYIAIAKIKNNPDGRAYCIKYHFNDLLKFTKFLDEKWPEWKWYNVYSNEGINKGVQIGNFTNRKKPEKRSF